ncbi:WD repeat-containing protein slp1 [Umbelopsis sp. WA50703]
MGSSPTRKGSTARSSVARSGALGNGKSTSQQTLLPFVPVSKAQAIALPLSPAKTNSVSNALLDTKALSNGTSKSPTGTLKQSSLLSRLKSVKSSSANSVTKSTKENQPTSSSQPTPSATNSSGPRRTLKRSNSAFSSLDIVGKDWLQNSPTTTKRSCKVKSDKTHYDRFIPNRDGMNLASSQFNLSNDAKTPYLDHASQEYKERVAQACGIIPGQRILAFKAKPPTSDKEDLRKYFNPLMKTSTSSSSKRRILTAPEKILDAPYMLDDFYLNLLDWSSLNVIAIALDKSIYLWNADIGEIKALNYQSETNSVASVSWSSDGSYLAVGTSDGDTQVWDVETNTKLRSMTGHESRVGVLSWDKHIVSSGARDGSIWHHDVRVAQHKVSELHGHTDEVCGLKWRSDGVLLASGGNDNLVNIWDARSTKPKFTKASHNAAVKAMAWCPWNLNLLATGGGTSDKHVHFWNTTTTARLHSIFTGSQVSSIIWSTQYKELVTSHGLPNNQLSVWEYPTLKKVADIPAHDSRILHMAASPDGQLIASAAADENLKFWRIFENLDKGKISKKEDSNKLVSVGKNKPQQRRSMSIR